MHEGHKAYILDIQYFAFFVLFFPRAPKLLCGGVVCFVVKHILTYETAPVKTWNHIIPNDNEESLRIKNIYL